MKKIMLKKKEELEKRIKVKNWVDLVRVKRRKSKKMLRRKKKIEIVEVMKREMKM